MHVNLPAALLAAMVAAPLHFVAAPGSPIPTGPGPADVLLADFDGDRRLDVAVATRAGVILRLGDGRGGFGPPLGPLPARGTPHLLAAADLDRDGRTDLLATSHDSHEVTVWHSAGGGRLEPALGAPLTVLDGGKAHNHGLAVGDLNGDGWMDVTTADDEAHVLTVLLGGPAGLRRRPGPPSPVGNSPYPHALADLDQDGDLDAVLPHTGASSVGVLLGDGRGGFAPAAASPVHVAARPFYVALGDLDGDRDTDAVVTHDDSTSITLLLGDGRGRLAPAPGPRIDVGRRSWKAKAADMDGDGRLDIVLGAGGKLAVLASDGRGRFRPVAGAPFAVGRGAWSVALGDIDGDDRLDAVTADLEDGTLTVLLARGSGWRAR